MTAVGSPRHPEPYDRFEKQFPNVKVVRGVRFVESGAAVTAAGVTAGVDLSRRIIERFYGRDIVERIAPAPPANPEQTLNTPRI